MAATAIVGANWGDEGKGKITDVLTLQSDVVVRFQGGRNAGHTIINDYGKFVLHLLPSGVFHRHATNVLGAGVALDVEALFSELEKLKSEGVPEPSLQISDRAQVVLPFHALLDAYEEERLADSQFGSTKVGIAPFYADKYLKVGVQVSDLFDPDRLRARLTHSLAAKNVLFATLYGKPVVRTDELIPGLMEQGQRIQPFLCDAVELLHNALQGGKRILLEGQLGALRDPDHGIYPFPTSSHPLAGFASVGAGLPPYAITEVIAVAKAYSSCVGAGPFVTELEGEAAEELRCRGGYAGEYGATTGRPRRVGWFDAVATRYGCRVQGATAIALTGLDVLSYLEEIPICVAYDLKGSRTSNFPVPAKLEDACPVFENLPGWRADISDIRLFEHLPREARMYLERVEELVEVPITMISVGPQREAILRRSADPELV